MQKNKVKILFYVGKLIARTWIINIPAMFILLVLLILDQINWMAALISLISFWIISSGIIALIFKDLDDFIAYLTTTANDFNAKLPKFKKSLFSSKRLANAYQSVRSLWQQQALSDTYILQNLPDPLIMIDNNQKIVFINDAGQKNFPKIKIGLSLNTPFPKIDLTNPSSIIQIKKSYYQIRIDRLPSPTRLGATTVLQFHDMTSFYQFQQQQTDFFANASHELKTPLAVMNGAIETLQGPAQSDVPAQQHFLDLIAKQNQKMSKLVGDLLMLTKSEQKIHHPQPIHIILLIQKVIQDLNPPTTHPIQIQASKQMAKINLDEQEGYHIFPNLIDNAIKYATENTPIKIQIFQKDGLCVRIINQGKTILHPERIFERFYRENIHPHVTGTGLGLSIVQQLVQKNQGRIFVKSQKGTTQFTVVWPIYHKTNPLKHPTFPVVNCRANVPNDAPKNPVE